MKVVTERDFFNFLDQPVLICDAHLHPASSGDRTISNFDVKVQGSPGSPLIFQFICSENILPKLISMSEKKFCDSGQISHSLEFDAQLFDQILPSSVFFDEPLANALEKPGTIFSRSSDDFFNRNMREYFFSLGFSTWRIFSGHCFECRWQPEQQKACFSCDQNFWCPITRVLPSIVDIHFLALCRPQIWTRRGGYPRPIFSKDDPYPQWIAPAHPSLLDNIHFYSR